MKKALIIVGIASAVLLMGATVVGYQDWQLRGSAPPSPASGWLRMWADTTAGKFRCLTSAGAACYFDSAANSLTLQTGGTNNGSQTALNLVAGSNVTLTNSGADVTINSTNSGSSGTTIWSGTGTPNGSDVAPHNMTSDSAPSPYAVTASPAEQQGGYRAFDGPVSSCTPPYYNSNCSGWGTGNNGTFPASLELDLGAGNSAIIGSFSMVGSNLNPLIDNWYGTGAEPRNFTLQGSNDNSTWNTVSTQSSISWSSTSQVQNFLCSVTTTAYRYWKVVITANNGGTASGFIGQLYLYAAGVTSGVTGDFYYQTSTNQWYGPRPSGGSPIWPLVSNADFSHFVGNTAKPAVSLGTGAGTGATSTITGTDSSGEICVTTAGTPAASATLLTATYAVAYSSLPYVSLSASNANASALSGTGQVYYKRASSSASAGIITTGSVALATATQYCYDYLVQQ